jgi:glycosyltransferase involved in cell wall biosynthesis
MLHLNTIDDTVSILLKKLTSLDYLNQFALAGGTSLALQIGHRKSVDTDMFAFEDADAQEDPELLQSFPEWCDIKEYITGIINNFDFHG